MTRLRRCSTRSPAPRNGPRMRPQLPWPAATLRVRARLLPARLDLQVRQAGRFDLTRPPSGRIPHLPEEPLGFCTLLVETARAFEFRHPSSSGAVVVRYAVYGLSPRVCAIYFPTRCNQPVADLDSTPVERQPRVQGRLRSDRVRRTSCRRATPLQRRISSSKSKQSCRPSSSGARHHRGTICGSAAIVVVPRHGFGCTRLGDLPEHARADPVGIAMAVGASSSKSSGWSLPKRSSWFLLAMAVRYDSQPHHAAARTSILVVLTPRCRWSIDAAGLDRDCWMPPMSAVKAEPRFPTNTKRFDYRGR